MAGEWAEAEARRLCGCEICTDNVYRRGRFCDRATLKKGLRAGLEHAVNVANEHSFRAAQAIHRLLTNPPPPAGQRERERERG